MIRTLLIIAAAALVLAIVAIGGAFALGGSDLKQNGWTWTFVNDEGRHGGVRGGPSEPAPQISRTLAWTGRESLTVAAPVHVTYVPGDEAGVSITGPRDVVERLELRDGVLDFDRSLDRDRVTVSWSNGSLRAWSDADAVRVVVTAPNVRRFDLDGSGEIHIRDYDQDVLALSITGSGEIEATGRTARLTVDVTGSGEAELAALRTDDVEVDLSGSGDVTVAPTGAATVQISGSGDVTLATRPRTLAQDITGSGEVHQRY